MKFQKILAFGIMALTLLMAFSAMPLFANANSATIRLAYSSGASGNLSSYTASIPSSIQTGDLVVVSMIYYSMNSSSISELLPTDSLHNTFTQISTTTQASLSGYSFHSEWFLSTAVASGADQITLSTASNVSGICTSIFDVSGFQAYAASTNFGIGIVSVFQTGYYAIPASGISLVSSIATVSSPVSYIAGSGYINDSNAAAPCGGQYQIANSPVATNAPASLGSTGQLYYWFEEGISLAAINPSTTTTTTTSTTTSSSTVTTSSTTTSSSTSSTSKSSTSTSTSKSSTSSSISSSSSSTTTIGGVILSSDYSANVQPYLSQLLKIDKVLMKTYTVGNQHYGFDQTIGQVCGGNIEPSPAIGVKNGYNNACVGIDSNLEGGMSLDFFNSAQSVFLGLSGFSSQATTIYQTDRTLLSNTWLGIGACSSPFKTYNYPSSFPLLDRREAEYGFVDPYASTLIKPGIHIGGIGSNCGTQGQTWFMSGYSTISSSISNPLIVSEFPSSSPVGAKNDLEELSFYIDETYMQCIAGTASCSLWQAAYHNAMAQYPFRNGPREALHFIQATRATGAWQFSNMTYNGLSASQMLSNTIHQVFTPSGQIGPTGLKGDVGSDGGLTQTWGSGGSDTPEPNFQAMIAFDPRMPVWFTFSCYKSGQC